MYYWIFHQERTDYRPSQGPTLPSVTGCVIFRAAEAYLNYMEADYELTHALDANSQKYWKALRERAGMDTDYQKTITHTNLEKEVDFARYSGSDAGRRYSLQYPP